MSWPCARRVNIAEDVNHQVCLGFIVGGKPVQQQRSVPVTGLIIPRPRNPADSDRRTSLVHCPVFLGPMFAQWQQPYVQQRVGGRAARAILETFDEEVDCTAEYCQQRVEGVIDHVVVDPAQEVGLSAQSLSLPFNLCVLAWP